MKKRIALYLIKLMVLSIFLTGTVSAIEEPKVVLVGALPDQPFLYFLKTKIKEPIILMFTTGENDIQKRLEFLETRRLELRVLASKPNIEDKLEKLSENVYATKNEPE